MGRSFHAVDLVDVTYICHDGQKNMKWGQRLYQEPGTNHWTELGKLRYGNAYNKSLYDAAKSMTEEELKAAVNRKNAEESFINAYKQQSAAKQKIAKFAEKILDTALETAGRSIGGTIGAQLSILADNAVLSKITSKIEGAEDYVLRERWGKEDWKRQKEAAEERKAQKIIEESMTKDQRKAAEKAKTEEARAAAQQRIDKAKADADKKKAEAEEYVSKKKAEAEELRKTTAENTLKTMQDAQATKVAKDAIKRAEAQAKEAKKQENAAKKQENAEKKQERKEEARAKEQAKKFGEEFSKFVKGTADLNIKLNGKTVASNDLINSVFNKVTGSKISSSYESKDLRKRSEAWFKEILDKAEKEN